MTLPRIEVEALMLPCERVEIPPETARELARVYLAWMGAPVAFMDTRDVLGICAPTEEDFPALYAIQGRRVRLVVDDERG